jgi:2-dehydropantoate 2-reductase
MIKLAAEVVAVGSALGVQVEPINGVPAEKYGQAEDGQILEEVKSILSEGAAALGEGRPSMLQDVLKGRRTEIDFLNGYVVEKGREAGVATPLCEEITRVIREVESGRRKPDASNIQPLLDMA